MLGLVDREGKETKLQELKEERVWVVGKRVEGEKQPKAQG